MGFAVRLLPKAIRDVVDAGRMRLSDDGYVQVYIHVTDITDANLNTLTSYGVWRELHDEQQRIVQARVPAQRLEAVAALAFVEHVRLPDYGYPNVGSVTTEGDAILNADQVRALFGVDGTGVTVGVISDGIGGIFATGCTVCGGLPGGPIATGDLPATTGTRNAGGVLTSTTGGLIAQSFRADGNLEGGLGGGIGAEGTAMLEIVHDLAPGAQLRFANFQTDLEFNQAVGFLTVNSDIVVDDIGFFTGPYDGTSLVSANTAAALNNNLSPIRGYFNAVGNHANKHYQDVFVDSTVDGQPFTTLLGNLHLFQSPGTHGNTDCFGIGSDAADAILLLDTSRVIVDLVWSDPFGASSNDYDLFLLRSDTLQVVAQSIDVQDGNDLPREWLTFTNTTGIDQTFFIVIQNFADAAAPVEFDMFIRGAPPLGGNCINQENNNFNTAFSSVPAQSDAGGSPVSVISVGAIDQADPGNDDIRDFSSNGPTNDGRLKPDVAAIDNVIITGAGGFGRPEPPFARFPGTSAAAPHGAGVAALLLDAAPCLLDGAARGLAPVDARTTLRNLLTSTAIDLGAAGPDNAFGAGRLDALAAHAASGTVCFPRNPLPTARGLNPPGVVRGSAGFTLRVQGSNFIPTSVVHWNGAPRSTTFIRRTELEAFIPSGDVATTGSAVVAVVSPGPGGGTSNPKTFPILATPNPLPSISFLSPNSATAGARSGLTLIVNGANFVAHSQVRWNGSPRPTTLVGNQLHATIVARDLAAAGTAQVAVVTPQPGGGTSSTLPFTINNPAPVVTSLFPGTIARSSPDFTLTVDGSAFVPDSTVRFNGTDLATTFVSSSLVRAVVPSTMIGTAGIAAVTVLTTGPAGGLSNSLPFTIDSNPNPTPAITSVSPNIVPSGRTGLLLTVDGSGFVPGSVVRWDGSDRPTTFIASTRLLAVIPDSDVASAGNFQVTVFSPGPGGGPSNTATVTVTP
ncbi:MAG: IPT/TIG domain-containing protein [Candidatus Binatia bacterium]